MNKQQAIKLANDLANEAEAELVAHIYMISQSANSTEVWCVIEMDQMRHNTPPLQVWVSPDLSFPL